MIGKDCTLKYLFAQRKGSKACQHHLQASVLLFQGQSPHVHHRTTQGGGVEKIEKIKINKKHSNLDCCSPQVISLRPYITVTHGLLLPGEPDQIIARAAPQLRRCNHQFGFLDL